MKTLYPLIALTLFPLSAMADSASVDVFRANDGVRLVGRNVAARGAPCSARFEDYALYYSFVADITTGTAPRANSISAGHFSKAFARRALVHSSGHGFDPGCYLGVGCAGRSSLTILYRDNRSIAELVETVQGKITARCVF